MQILDDLSQAYGGYSLLAKRLGVHFTRVYAWKRDGVIPPERLVDVVEAARDKGVGFAPSELLPDTVRDALAESECRLPKAGVDG